MKERIRKIEWKITEPRMLAFTPIGVYQIQPREEGSWGGHVKWLWAFNGGFHGCRTKQQCIKAAERDFKCRVLECLEPEPLTRKTK